MIKKVFRQMLVTQIISSMTVMICMLIDSIIIGRYLGVDSMTAYGLATPVLLIFAAFGSMLSAGVQVMCGKTIGSGDRKATDRCYTIAVTLALGVSIIGLIAVLAFSSQICVLLGAEDNSPIFQLTRDYLRGFIIGAPAFIFAQIMVPFMQISGNRTRLVIAVVMMTVADIAGDLLNVFAFECGTFGMGLASSISYYIAFLIGIVYFLKKSCMFRLRFKELRIKEFGTIIRYGIPTVINQISLVLLVFLFNKILLEVGQSKAVAAYSVINTVGNFCYAFGAGVASVALMLSSIFYIDEDKTSLLSLVRTMTFFAVVLDVAVTAVIFAAAPVLVRLFLADDAAAIDLARNGLRLFSLSLVASSLNTTFKNYYQGTNRTPLTETISVLQNFALTALFAFVLSRFIGTKGVWLSYLCGETATLLIISVIVWIKYRRISFVPEAFSLLKHGFGVKDADIMECTIFNSSDVISVSKKAEQFCRDHGESPKQSMIIALCIEEMANNIVTHGFTKDNKPHTIDVRIVFRNSKKVLSIRDNCVNFDPINYLELHKTEDPMAHIGIRMVMKLAKEANYVNTLGLNNLTLVL